MFRKKPAPITQVDWLIVGLGNPGAQYRGTRHNIGFAVIDRLAEAHRILVNRSKHRAQVGTGTIDGVGVALAKPLTFMNLSGQSVGPLLKEYGLGPDRLLIVADDLDLPVGRVRMKPKGSAGGHNGHKSIIQTLGTTEYARLKLGIGSVDRAETIDHVLGTFHDDEKADVEAMIRRSIAGIEVLVSSGLDLALNRVNEGG